MSGGNQYTLFVGQNGFGRLLRFWRSVRKISQEELADQVGVSSRQISRVENGSSRPSEALIEDIARALKILERDHNHLRFAAGYTPIEETVDVLAPEMKWFRKAMTLVLKANDPFPSVLLNGPGDIFMVNRAWVSFYQTTVSPQTLNKVTNHWEFLVSSDGIGPYLEGWENTLSVIYMSLMQSALLYPSDSWDRILETLRSHPNLPADWAERATTMAPMASYRIKVPYNGELQEFLCVNQVVGALGPTVYLSEPKLSINTLYPQDDNLVMELSENHELKHPLLYY